MSCVQHDLDELTFTGTAINDLVLQLTRTRGQYRRALLEGRERVDGLLRKLHSHIVKSEPFVNMCRKVKQVSYTWHICRHELCVSWLAASYEPRPSHQGYSNAVFFDVVAPVPSLLVLTSCVVLCCVV